MFTYLYVWKFQDGFFFSLNLDLSIFFFSCLSAFTIFWARCKVIPYTYTYTYIFLFLWFSPSFWPGFRTIWTKLPSSHWFLFFPSHTLWKSIKLYSTLLNFRLCILSAWDFRCIKSRLINISQYSGKQNNLINTIDLMSLLWCFDKLFFLYLCFCTTTFIACHLVLSGIRISATDVWQDNV